MAGRDRLGMAVPPTWSPSPPPPHNTGNNYHPWDGLRFVLVKLDNYSLHLFKPRWSVFMANHSLHQVKRYNGAHGAGTGVAGYDLKTIFDNTGGTGSCMGQPVPLSYVESGTNCPLTTIQCSSNNCQSVASACIPWHYSGNLTAGLVSNNYPNNGWLTQMDCMTGGTATDSYSMLWTNGQHLAHPQHSGCTCNNATGGDWKYAVPSSEMHPGSFGSHTTVGGGMTNT